jgi:hypothetical protein
LCADGVIRLPPHRYRGIASAYDRQAITLGAAYATSFGLAAGLSIEGFRARVFEQRHSALGQPPALPGGRWPTGDDGQG